MAVRPHVSYTLYDEVARGLRNLTGASFEQVLLGQQFLYRAVGVTGVYLLVSAIGLPFLPTFVVVGIVSLGATVSGPTVLTVEYEPVPRGFAMAFVWLSLGTMAWRRFDWATVAAAIAWSFHPPTAMVWWLLLAALVIWRRDWRSFAILCAGPVLVAVTLLGQPPSPERPPLFARIDAEMARLQQIRASYNWVSLWFGLWWPHYSLLLAALVAGLWRIWPLLSFELRVALTVLPAIGVLSLPISYLLLEKLMWVIVPQYQPGRYLMYVTIFAVLNCAIAGARAALMSRLPEAAVFFFAALLVPLSLNVARPTLLHAGVAAGLAVVAAFSRYRPAAVAACLLPFVLIPTAGGVVNYTRVDSPTLGDLIRWAQSSTSKDAVFQFADVRRGLQPGIFRARAVRAIYADWKAGGQVNFLHDFGDLWWERWQMAERAQPLRRYSEAGIDYVVFTAARAPKGAPPAYRNSDWVVFHTGKPVK
jgi:hypothetical protein